ncbi:hypothetical protein HPB51_028685 [Rhipicephalus microplus]|uniref:Uncharacterized protein n=1 Tax=Rhipicephalus microplus TaxID=6941 RepID=A0A9J6CW91_RHIMP|nr:hypothetical protein HPB51_028685 [Rhipicephalus microplus]
MPFAAESYDARLSSSCTSRCSWSNCSRTPEFAIWLVVPAPPKPSSALYRRHDFRGCDTATVAAPTRRKTSRVRRKSDSKSSFSGRSTSSRGPDTSPSVSSPSSTEANIPEFSAILATHQEADESKRQRDDSEDRAKPSVSRRRGGPPKKMNSGRRRTTNAIHDFATVIGQHLSGLRTRKCSGQSLSKSSLEGGRPCVERKLEQEPVTDSTAVFVPRRPAVFVFGRKPGRRLFISWRTRILGSS